MQKGQTNTVGYAVGVQYAVGMQFAVGTFSAKRSNPHGDVCSRYAVRSMQYAVGVSRCTVDLANMGVGDHYL